MSEPIVADEIRTAPPADFPEQWVCLHKSWNYTRPEPKNSEWRIGRLPSSAELARRKAAESRRAELLEKAIALAECIINADHDSTAPSYWAVQLARDILAASRKESGHAAE